MPAASKPNAIETAVSPDLIDRFRADLALLWPEMAGGGTLGLAVSGGGDSLAMLLLAHASLPGRVVAATVDHRLRAESTNEAAMVAKICAELRVGHETIPVTVETGNLHDRAREARYAALCHSFGHRGVTVMASAHHADDQAETVLMRLARGSGVSGLAGIRARRVLPGEDPLGDCLLVRPLLHWRRSELTKIVADAGISPVCDASNDDERFDRARMRQALTALPDIDALAIARSARFLQDAEEIVHGAVADASAKHVYRQGETVWFHWGHPRMIEIEMVAAILAEFGSTVARSAAAQAVAQLHADGHATLGGVVARRTMHRIDGGSQVDAWRFDREPPRRFL